MTLCLAWKVKNEINFLSDSRLTAGENVVTNNANKIFSIYVNAYKGDVTNRAALFASKYGLCFAGSYLNGSVLADTISELTSEIFIEDISHLSFDLISGIAFFVYENVSRHLMEIHNEKGFSEVFFSGINPITGQTELAKFSSKMDNGEIKFLNEKIDIDSGRIVYLGSKNAIEKAEILESKLNNSYTHFHLISEIIDDNNIVDVGGCVQFGCVLQGNFRTYGIVDFDYEQLKSESGIYLVKNIYTFRSLPMSLNDTRIKNLKCTIGKVYMSPFNDRQKKMEEKVNQLNNLL